MNDYYNYNNYYYPNANRHNYNANSDRNNDYIYDPYQGFIRGNMFKNLYNPYKIKTPFDIEPINEQAKMLTDIDSLSFAMLDLNLYLDVHPDDQETINLFTKYRNQKEQIANEYQRLYGPLTTNSDATSVYPWSWNKSPWPWEEK